MKVRLVIAVCSLMLALPALHCSGTGGSDAGSGGGSGGGTGGGTGGGMGGGTGGGAGGGTGGGTGGGAGGGGGSTCEQTSTTCNTLALAGGPVAVQNSPTTPPAAMGGTVVPGLYVLTAVTQYDPDAGAGATGDTRHETLQLGATSVQIVSRRPLQDGGCEDEHSTGNLSFDGGTTVGFARACPVCTGMNCGDGEAGYTASATDFQLIEPGNVTSVMTFTKQ